MSTSGNAAGPRKSPSGRVDARPEALSLPEAAAARRCSPLANPQRPTPHCNSRGQSPIERCQNILTAPLLPATCSYVPALPAAVCTALEEARRYARYARYARFQAAMQRSRICPIHPVHCRRLVAHPRRRPHRPPAYRTVVYPPQSTAGWWESPSNMHASRQRSMRVRSPNPHPLRMCG